MRFGPAIFEAHVRTTVRENYYKWIFQHLVDTEEVKDTEIDSFELEYDSTVYKNLHKRTLVCSHKETTRFPFEQYEFFYGTADAYTSTSLLEDVDTPAEQEQEEQEIVQEAEQEEPEKEDVDDDDEDEYCSANSRGGDQSSVSSTATSATVATTVTGRSINQEKGFFMVKKSDDKTRFKIIRDKQRKNLSDLIRKKRIEHKTILSILMESVKKVREMKMDENIDEQTMRDTVSQAKRKLRLFKDPGEVESTGTSRKRYRKSLDNQTRYSDSKVSYFSKANDAIKAEENEGIRKSFEVTYKRIWNEVLCAPKEQISAEPLQQVKEMSRDLEGDVDQLLLDSIDAYEEV